MISPFSRGGFVCGNTFDHTSTLRLIESRFGVEVPHLTKWRRETCGDLTAAFGFGTPADTSIPTLPETERAFAVALSDVGRLPAPKAATVQAMPKQETGFQRRRRGG